MARQSLFVRILALGVMCLAGSTLQAQVLASGPPPLTNDMVKRATGFFEWVLDSHFTPAQAHEYEQMLVRDWSDTAKRKSTMDLMQMLDKLNAATPQKRDQVQAELQRTLVEGMRKETQDPASRLMLAIYDAAHPVNTPVSPASSALSGPGPNAAHLIGKWRSTKVAATQYGNLTTGALAPTSGSNFTYEFLPDGTYQFTGLMQVTTYGCTSSIWRTASGKYHAEGGRVTLQPAGGVFKSQVCGGPLKEKPDSLDQVSYVFQFEKDSNGEVLVMNGTDGKSRPDYFRHEK